MRTSSVEDCKSILKHYDVDYSSCESADIGGTDIVFLDHSFKPNPLREMSPNLYFLDKGFNVELIGAKADQIIDFLDPGSVSHMKDRFDLVYCFDTLEHAANPFLFCEHLIYVTRPLGYIYVATVFEWSYHPSPEDYFRFSPEGLRELFQSAANRLAGEFNVLHCGWGSDERGVLLLGQKCPPGQSAFGGYTECPKAFAYTPDWQPPRSHKAKVKSLARRFLSVFKNKL
jgi:SAM-dependent methyltransferase